MKCALVTGATGFIGGRLVKALCEANIRVKALSRYGAVDGVSAGGRVIPVVADLTQAASIDKVCADVETVFHLAGYAHAAEANDKRAAMIHHNLTVEGTRALLAEARRARAKRFIFVSSAKAIGEGGEECVDEAVEASPITEYGQAKLEAERLVFALGRECGMQVCILRLPLVYGPGVKGNLLRMINAIDRGRFPPVPDVKNKRSMVHVDDVVRVLCLAAENPRADGEIYFVTDGRGYSTYEICSLMRRALGRSEPKWNLPLGVLKAAAGIGDVIGGIRGRPFFFNSFTLDKLVGSAWYSSEKIKRDFGFRPTHTLETALPEIVNEYRREAK